MLHSRVNRNSVRLSLVLVHSCVHPFHDIGTDRAGEDSRGANMLYEFVFWTVHTNKRATLVRVSMDEAEIHEPWRWVVDEQREARY